MKKYIVVFIALTFALSGCKTTQTNATDSTSTAESPIPEEKVEVSTQTAQSTPKATENQPTQQAPDTTSVPIAESSATGYTIAFDNTKVIITNIGDASSCEFTPEEGTGILDAYLFDDKTLIVMSHENPSSDTLIVYDLTSKSVKSQYSGTNFVWSDPADMSSLHYVQTPPHFSESKDKQDEIVDIEGNVLYTTKKGNFITELKPSSDGKELNYTESSYSEDSKDITGSVAVK